METERIQEAKLQVSVIVVRAGMVGGWVPSPTRLYSVESSSLALKRTNLDYQSPYLTTCQALRGKRRVMLHNVYAYVMLPALSFTPFHNSDIDGDG